MSETVFWILSWTWGFPMTFIGSLVFILLQLAGIKPSKNQYGWFFEIGEHWGGFTMGPFIIVNKNPSQNMLDHEFGHSLQNCYIGPMMPFISIASAVRYWYREILFWEGIPYENMPDYDDIWFEGTATYLGKHYHKFTSKG